MNQHERKERFMKSAAPRRRPLRWSLATGLTTAAALAFATAGYAIQPQTWVHTTESDFEAGEVENVVLTNLGDVKLANDSETIGEFPEQASIVYDVQAF